MRETKTRTEQQAEKDLLETASLKDRSQHRGREPLRLLFIQPASQTTESQILKKEEGARRISFGKRDHSCTDLFTD